MVWCADKAYGKKEPAAANLEKRFATVCGGSYKAHILAGDIHGGIAGFQPNMWDDPFFETKIRTFTKDSTKRMARLAGGFAKLARRLKPCRHDRQTGDLDHAFNTAQAFAERYALAAELLAAYRNRDKNRLQRIRGRIPEVMKSIRAMENSFRRMWLAHNKPEGLETIQGRFGMLAARYREMAVRIGEYLSGRVKNIAELDYRCPPT
jgi:hypothetical protein